MKINFPTTTERTYPVEALRAGQCFTRLGEPERRVFMAVGRLYNGQSYSASVRTPKKVLAIDLGAGKRLALDPDEPVIELEVELTVVKIGRSG
jgi:hypothetical protein